MVSIAKRTMVALWRAAVDSVFPNRGFCVQPGLSLAQAGSTPASDTKQPQQPAAPASPYQQPDGRIQIGPKDV